MGIFYNYSKYYDHFYKNKNYLDEAIYIKNILHKNNLCSGNLLEFGSGSGVHGSILKKEGYRVFGLEKSRFMVAEAHKKGNTFVQFGDIRTFTPNKKYDAVVSLFHVLSYQQSNKAVSNVFANANKSLKKNGLFIFDFWYSPAVLHFKPKRRRKVIIFNNQKIIRIADPVNFPNINCVRVDYSFYLKQKNKYKKMFKEQHLMRHFSLPEIDYFAEQNNFKLLQSQEFLTRKTPSSFTWSVCVVLKKRSNF